VPGGANGPSGAQHPGVRVYDETQVNRCLILQLACNSMSQGE
jgi:hypothetical protein